MNATTPAPRRRPRWPWIVMIVIGLFWGLELFLAKRWGADVDTLDVREGNRAFRAKRDEQGVWQITAERDEDLWFAFGYVQGVDRDFQIELFRRISRGELSGWLGGDRLDKDFFMRASSRVARAEWDAMPVDSRDRKATEAFVAGLAKHRQAPLVAEIFESRFLPTARASLPAWEPWEVLSVARFHTWEFSYDVSEEQRAYRMEEVLGVDLARFLLPFEPRDSQDLYSQKTGLPRATRSLPGPGFADPAVHVPTAAGTAQLLSTGTGRLARLDHSLWERDAVPVSNAWILSEPKTALAPTICNDPHLASAWPSALYPIRYELTSRGVRGTGFMLPGIPAMVIGTVEVAGEKPSALSWGITMATFADMQDFVKLSPATLAKAVKTRETFELRDAMSGKVERREVDMEWTEFGPRVDGALKWTETAGPVALDWMGYRKTPSPLGFFLDRNLEGLQGLEEDLSSRWAYPAVNFNWISRDGAEPVHAGHALTGIIFERDRSEGYRRRLPEADARARRFSHPKARPFVESKVSDRSVFFVTGNQRIYPGELGLRLAFEWYDGARADRILAQHEKALSAGPEWSQTDFYSPVIAEFVKDARTRLPADRLCSQGDAQLRTGCQLVLSRLDAWTGVMDAADWVPTIAASWFAHSKQALWSKAGENPDRENARLQGAWQRMGASHRILRQLLRDEKTRAKWQSLTTRDFDDALSEAFARALNSLINALGPVPERWSWGSVHRVQWAHPLTLLPSVGEWASRSLFGDYPVSGGADSPGRFDMRWDPQNPTVFPMTHGSVMRSCVALEDGQSPKVRWANISGVSGNPLSKWSRAFSEASYYANKLVEAK